MVLCTLLFNWAHENDCFFNLWYWRSGCNGKMPYLSEIMIFCGYMTQVSDNSMHRHLMILFMCLLSFAKILPRTIKRWKISQFSMHDESVTTFDIIYLIFQLSYFVFFSRFIHKLYKRYLWRWMCNIQPCPLDVISRYQILK